MTTRYFVGSALYGGASTNPFIDAEVVQLPAPSSLIFNQTNSNLGLELAKKADASELEQRVTSAQLALALDSKVDTSFLTVELSAIGARIDDRVSTSTFIAQLGAYATTAAVDAKLESKVDAAALEGKADLSALTEATTSLTNLVTAALETAAGDKTDEAYVNAAVRALELEVERRYATIADPLFQGQVFLPVADSVNIGALTLADYVSGLLNGAQGGLAPISNPIFLNGMTLPPLNTVFHPDPDEGQLSLRQEFDRLQTSINNLAIGLGVGVGVGGVFSFVGDVALFIAFGTLQGQVVELATAVAANGANIGGIQATLATLPTTYAPSDSPVFLNQVELPDAGAVYVGRDDDLNPITLLDLLQSQALTDLEPVNASIAALDTALREAIALKANSRSPVFTNDVELPGPEFVYVGRDGSGARVTLRSFVENNSDSQLTARVTFIEDDSLPALNARVSHNESVISTKASVDTVNGVSAVAAGAAAAAAALSLTVSNTLTPRLEAVEAGKADRDYVDQNDAVLAAAIASTINANQAMLDEKADVVYVDTQLTNTSMLIGNLSGQVTNLFTGLQSKANQVDVQSQLAAKADTSDLNAALTTVNNALGTKASKQVVDLLVAQSEGDVPLPARIAFPLDRYSADGTTVQLAPNPPLAGQPYHAIIQAIAGDTDRVGHIMIREKTPLLRFGYKEHLWTVQNPTATYAPCNLSSEQRLFEIVLIQNGRVFDACTLQTGASTALIR